MSLHVLIVLLFCTVELLNNIVVHESPVRDRTVRTRALHTCHQGGGGGGAVSPQWPYQSSCASYSIAHVEFSSSIQSILC